MKKYKLVRQSKKVFAAVLAASLMLTSVAPGAVYASETEMTETAVQSEEATEAVAIQSEEATEAVAIQSEEATETAAQSEEATEAVAAQAEEDPAQAVAEQETDPNAAEEAQPIAAETEAPETEADTPEITEAPSEPETPVVTETPAGTEEQPTETPTEPATEETEQPTETETPVESETETTETELSEAVKALQERINALPTVEEFQAMADGTTVEDSTLNQKQMDVYNEAQAIADALDQLSEEEQGQVDTSKLEALFEYFNSMTEETALSPGSTVTLKSSTQYIEKAGTYNIKASSGISASKNMLYIRNTSASDNIVLNIQGNITVNDSVAIIVVSSPCNLTINGNGKTIKQTSSGNIVNNDNSNATVKLNNCVFVSGGTVVVNGGTVYVQSGSYSRTGSSGQVFSNAGGTLYIQGGTITNVEGTNDAVAAGNVYMTGGTVSAPNGGGIRLSQSGTKAEITGGTISGSKYGVYLKSGNPTCKIGNVTFSGNTNDVYLASGHTFTLSTDYVGANNIKVGIADSISGSTKRQITTAGTDKSMLAKVTSVNSKYSVNYSKSGKYLYLWIHNHKLSYSSDGNTITAKCTVDSDCQYYEDGLTLKISAEDRTYSGNTYDGASVTNNITSVTGTAASAIKYVGRDGTSYSESTTAPVNAGKYTAKVTIGGQTATADFEITKAQVAIPDKVDTSYVYNGQPQTYPITDSSLYTVTGNTQTDAGTYTVTVSLKDKTNSEWADGTTDDLKYTFIIEKADSTVSGTPVHPVENLTYTGTDQTLVSADDITGGTIYYRVGEDGTWQETLPTGVDAGEYEIFYYVKGDKNHKDNGSEEQPMGSCKATVAKKKITASADGFEGTYDENASRSIDVKVTDPADGYKITYSTTGKEGSYTEENPAFTEVGEYTVYYRVEAGKNYQAAEGSATVKIAGATFADGDITASGYQGTYDGASHKISVGTKGTADGASITYSTTGEADSYTDEVPEFKNATDGTTVYYKVSKKGYQDVTGSVEVSIARKNVTATVSVKDKVYDGTTNADVEASVDTGIKNETLTVSGVTGTFASKDVAEDIEVSVNSDAMTVTAGEGTKAENYNVSCEAKASGKITAKSVTVSITANGGTYGSVKAAEAVLDGVAEADQGATPVKLTYTGNGYDSTDVPTQAGTYTVTASIDNKNYVLTGTTTAKFVIAKAEVAAPEITSKQYTGEKQTADVADTGLYTVTKNEGGEKVGKYPVILTLKDTNNYKWESTEKADLELTFEIKAIQNTWTTEPSISGWTYGDTASAPEGSAAHGTVSVSYAKAGSDKFTSEVPTEAGNYTARFTVEGTDSYSELTKDVSFTVAAREVTVTVADKTITYGDAEPEYTSKITEGSLVEGDDLKLTYSREQGTAAKTYAITAASANSNYKVNVVPGTLTIQKKDLTITPEKATKVYGDTDPQFQYSVSGLVKGEKEADILTGVLARSEGETKGTYVYEIGSLADASGNYNVKLDADAAKFTITAKEVTLTWSSTNLTYNGSEQSVTAQVSNPAFASDTFTLEYTGNTATNAGSYTAEVTSVGNDNYVLTKNSNQKVNWSIAKTDAQYQLPAAVSGLTYNGTDQTLVTAEKPDGGTWMYKVGDGKWSDQLPTGLDAGTYDIFYKVVGDDNHKDSTEGQLTVTIAKKAVVVSGITAEDKTYDGNTSAVLNFDGVKLDGIVGEDSLKVTASGVFEDKNAGEKKVLISNLVLDGASAKNYVLAEGQQSEAAATIHAKEITAVITPNGGTYEGTIAPATAVLNGLVGEDKPEITLTYAGTANDGTEADGNVPTHAGTYTVTASITDGNYSLKADGASAQFVVAKADPALSVSAVADKNYGEEAFKLETSNKGDGAKSYTSSDENVVTVDENGLVTIVGAGEATLTVSLAESANYTADQAEITVTVKKIDHSLVIEQVAYEVTYGDPTFSVAAQAGDTEAAVKYASSNEDVASVDENGVVTIKNAGEATITLEMDESGNYNAVTKTVTVTVLPKAVTVTPDAQTKVFEEADPELTYMAEGLVGEDTLADITLARAEGENAGTYDITAEAKEGSNPNYSITCQTGTFIIKQKPIDTAEVTLGDALKYTGKEQTQNVAKVTLDGKEIPADAYTVENNTATEAGTYTLTIKAKEDGNYTGTRPWTYVIAPTQDGQITETPDGSVKIGDGTLKMQVKTEGGVPSASLVTGKAQIIEMLIQSGDITADELAQIAGGASVEIILTVKDGSATVSAEAKAQMEKGANGYTIGQYLDISLFKYMTVNGVTQDGIQLRQTAGQITISVSLPENLINTDSKVTRTYAVIRNHDGKVDVLNTTYDATGQTLTFQTNLFSDYAIAYQDVKEPETETETEPETKQTETEKKSDTTGTSQTTSPKTGDTTNVAGYGMALLISAMALAAILLKRRKRTEK